MVYRLFYMKCTYIDIQVRRQKCAKHFSGSWSLIKPTAEGALTHP